MLRLTGQFTTTTCPRCSGRGRIPQPPTMAVRTGVGGFNAAGPVLQQGTGHPIPCPDCKGKKLIQSS